MVGGGLGRTAVLVGALVLLALPSAAATAGQPRPALQNAPCDRHCVRVWAIHYRSHAGSRRNAYVVLPSWYRPGHNPRIPLVISPHGRGVTAWSNVIRWGRLPAFGGFAVVNPEGQGRRLRLHSWGYAGQVADLARMPKIVSHAIPWLQIDTGHVYAFGT